MLGEEGLGEVQEVCNGLVVAVCPEGKELKGVRVGHLTATRALPNRGTIHI